MTAKSKLKKAMLATLALGACATLGVGLFLSFWKPFGSKAGVEKRSEYKQRAGNFNGTIFQNETELNLTFPVTKGEDRGVLSAKDVRPEGALPLAKPSFLSSPQIDEVAVTWFGHSSLLLQMHGLNVLIDPVLGKMASPVSFIGCRRFSELPIKAEELPKIDVLILSHDHYDHLDYDTILELDRKVGKYIVPLGVENHLERWGIDPKKVTTMAWWEETDIEGLTIGCTPARHFSGRTLNDRFASLWASWVFKDEYHLIYESGDSGYGQHYKEIHDKYGDFDFAMLDCAQYNPRWKDVHQTPEEAFRALQELGTTEAMPVHWGAFVLSTHPWDDSVSRLVRASQGSKVNIATPKLGQTVKLSELDSYRGRWYESIR